MVMLLGVLVACGDDDKPADTKAPEVTTGGNQGGETTAPPSGNQGGETTAPPSGNQGGETTAPPSGGNQGGTQGGENNTTNPTVTVDPSIKPSVEPENLGNPDGSARTFTFLVRSGRHAWFWGTDKSTDEVSVAAYKRNNLLNEMYNIEMAILENESSTSTWRTTLDAADGNIDVAIPDYYWELEYEGFFINLMRRPEIDDSESHWIQGWNNHLIINNRLYTLVGDAALEIMENWEVLFYNRDMAKDLGYYEDIFDMVDEGEWTVKEMISIMDDFELALMDNDESNDIWGAVYDSHSMAQQLYSAGLTLLETNRFTNIITDISNTPKNIALTEDVTALRHHNATNYFAVTARSDLGTKNGLFFAEQSFFYGSCLLNGKNIKKSAAFDYGVLIMPKHDVADDYRTGSYGVSFFTIPHSSSDKHASAVVLNTMNYLSGDSGEEKLGEDRLVYTYFETVVKGQVANLAEDFAMLDRIKASVRYDFGFVAMGTVSLQGSFTSAVHNNESIAVTMGDVAKKAEDGILEMMTFYGDARYAE